MPEEKINIQTEINSYPKALVINENSELSLLLVDGLLARGCEVYFLWKFFIEKINDCRKKIK